MVINNKFCLILIGVLLYHFSYSQSDRGCSVQITNKAETRKFFLYTFRSKLPVDSAIINQGTTYCFYADQEYPIYSLGTDGMKTSVFYFFKDPDTPVSIDFSTDHKVVVHDSRLNALWSESKIYQDSAMEVLINLRGATDSIFMQSKNSYEKWAFERLLTLMQTDTFVALRFLNFHLNKLERLTFANPQYIDSIRLMMEKFPIGSHPLLGNEMFRKIEDLSYMRKGASFYHFVVEGVNSDTIPTQQFSGSTILVDFWASWCKPCRAKNQTLKKYYDQIQSKNIVILGVSLDDKTEPWKSALEKDQLPWLQGKLFSKDKKLIQQKYNAHAIPLSLLFSSEGKLLEINPSLERLIK